MLNVYYYYKTKILRNKENIRLMMKSNIKLMMETESMTDFKYFN